MTKKKLGLITIFIIVLALSFVSSYSYAVPDPSYEFYVYDEADLMSNDLESYIININKNLYRDTGAQIVVVTINSLENTDINLYAVELFEEWKIGSIKEDNGILILIVPEEGQLWIETGYGAEGIFPASKTKRIIERHMIPYFKEDRYSDGILAGFNEIKAGFEEEYDIRIEESKNINNPIPITSDTQDGITIPRIFMVIGFILLVIIDFRFFNGMITYSLLRNIGRGRGGGGSRGGGSSGGGGRSGGGGAGGNW